MLRAGFTADKKVKPLTEKILQNQEIKLLKLSCQRIDFEYLRNIYPTWVVVYEPFWPKNITSSRDTRDYLEQILSIKENQFALAQNLVLLLDEAQETYTNTYFWNSLIKDINHENCGLRVVLASSYGNPGSLPFSPEIGTPSFLSPTQKISLSASGIPGQESAKLLLDREECFEVVDKFLRAEEEFITFTGDLKSVLYDLTGGHVGAVKGLAKMISNEADLKASKIQCPITTDDFHKFYLSDWGSFRQKVKAQGFNRGLPDNNTLRKREYALIFKEIATNGAVIYPATESEVDTERMAALTDCFKKGWLHRVRPESEPEEDEGENTVLISPSPLHSWFISALVIPSVSPTTPSCSIREFVIQIVSNFVPRHLSAPPRRPDRTEAPPLEAAYGFEIYRVLTSRMFGDLLVSPEYGLRVRGMGSIDFYIPSKKWGIEITRYGSQLEEHHGRFDKAYKSFGFEDAILLDCRRAPPEKKPELPKLVSAVFTEDFSEVVIYENLGRPLTDPIKLLEAFSSQV